MVVAVPFFRHYQFPGLVLCVPALGARVRVSGVWASSCCLIPHYNLFPLKYSDAPMPSGTSPGSQWVIMEKEGNLLSATVWEIPTLKGRNGTRHFLRVIIAGA